jgi:hypothetical protein
VNQFDLQAKLISRDVIRETPSGTPVVDFRVQYDGEISEAGFKRLVKLSKDSIGIGSWLNWIFGKSRKKLFFDQVPRSGYCDRKKIRILGENYGSSI